MRKPETQQSRGMAQNLVALLLGGLLALGIELIVLLLGSVAVSAGILKADATSQVTVVACLIGCFVGGSLACSRWSTRRFFGGLLTGVTCFLLILLVAVLLGDGPEIETQALIELAGCVIGGGLAGILAGGKKKKKRKNR